MEVSNKIIDLEYRTIEHYCDVHYLIAEYEVIGFRNIFILNWLRTVCDSSAS